MMRRLRLGDVVESERSLGSSTRAMTAGTSRRAATEGVADAPVPTAQTAGFTVHGTLDGTSPLQGPVGSLAWRKPVALIGPEWRACRRARSGRGRLTMETLSFTASNGRE